MMQISVFRGDLFACYQKGVQTGSRAWKGDDQLKQSPAYTRLALLFVQPLYHQLLTPSHVRSNRKLCWFLCFCPSLDLPQRLVLPFSPDIYAAAAYLDDHLVCNATYISIFSEAAQDRPISALQQKIFLWWQGAPHTCRISWKQVRLEVNPLIEPSVFIRTHQLRIIDISWSQRTSHFHFSLTCHRQALLLWSLPTLSLHRSDNPDGKFR